MSTTASRFMTGMAEAGRKIRDEVEKWIKRVVESFQKRRLLKKYTATVAMKPGVTNIRLTTNGVVKADLLLTQITYGFNEPTRAEFVDRSAFMERRRR